MRILKRAVAVIVVVMGGIAVLIGLLVAIAPWLDGPVNRIAGGPFSQSPVSFDSLDPATLTDVPVVELEVRLDARPSVEVAVLVHQQSVFIPATLRPAEKRWPRAIEQNPQVKLRVGERVFSALAHRVTDHDLHQQLAKQGAAKYSPSYFDADRTWFFRLSQAAR